MPIGRSDSAKYIQASTAITIYTGHIVRFGGAVMEKQLFAQCLKKQQVEQVIAVLLILSAIQQIDQHSSEISSWKERRSNGKLLKEGRINILRCCLS